MGTSDGRAGTHINQSESKSKAHQRALFKLRKSSAALPGTYFIVKSTVIINKQKNTSYSNYIAIYSE